MSSSAFFRNCRDVTPVYGSELIRCSTTNRLIPGPPAQRHPHSADCWGSMAINSILKPEESENAGHPPCHASAGLDPVRASLENPFRQKGSTVGNLLGPDGAKLRTVDRRVIELNEPQSNSTAGLRDVRSRVTLVVPPLLPTIFRKVRSMRLDLSASVFEQRCAVAMLQIVCGLFSLSGRAESTVGPLR